MHASKIFSILAFAATVIALPAPAPDADVAIVTEIVTKYVTAGVAAAPAPTQAVVNNNNGFSGYHHDDNDDEDDDTPSKVTSAAAKATGSSSSSDSSANKGSGYMGVVNDWRKKLGLKELIHDSKLEANAQKTTNDGGNSMVHELNPGSSAQVLAPGSASDLSSFEKAFVGGWLCERPSLSGLGNGCQQFGGGWAQNGETGHADILTSSDYSNIGCADNGHILGCDLS